MKKIERRLEIQTISLLIWFFFIFPLSNLFFINPEFLDVIRWVGIVLLVLVLVNTLFVFSKVLRKYVELYEKNK